MVGQVDGKVEEYRATLVRLRETFLAYAVLNTQAAVLNTRAAVLNTQAAVLQMRDDKSNQALDAGAQFRHLKTGSSN
jgi:hypothetical protein